MLVRHAKTVRSNSLSVEPRITGIMHKLQVFLWRNISCVYYTLFVKSMPLVEYWSYIRILEWFLRVEKKINKSTTSTEKYPTTAGHLYISLRYTIGK